MLSASNKKSNAPVPLGFTLIELLVVVAVIAILISLVVPAIGKAMNSAKTMKCMVQMRSIGQVGAVYGADHNDTIFTLDDEYEFTPDDDDYNLLGYTDGVYSIRSRMAHARALVRERLGDHVGDVGVVNDPVLLTYLVLYDYLLAENIERDGVVCPSDDYLLRVREENLNAGFVNVGEGDSEDAVRYARMVTSYKPVYFTYTKASLGLLNPTNFLEIAVTPHGVFDFTDRRYFPEVSHPSGKVWMHELYQRHFGKAYVYAHDEVRLPLLMFDGSVAIRRTGDANYGASPDHDDYDPDAPDRFTQFVSRYGIWFTPDDFVNKNTSSDERDVVELRFNWTYKGLRGVDY